MAKNKKPEFTATVIDAPFFQEELVKVIERIVEVPVPQLSDWDLYKALKDAGFYQGGIGQFMEDPQGTEVVYLPHASEIYAQFAQNPEGWGVIRDYLARAFLELQKH